MSDIVKSNVSKTPFHAREREPIGVIGVGWVGLVTAACFAELGHEVYARDVLADKVDALSRGEVPIYEPGLAELIQRNSARLHFSTDMATVLERARLLFCCVDTPPTHSGDADLTRVEAVVDAIGPPNGHALVMKSTVPVGTGDTIQGRSRRLPYVSNPEFLKEGSAVEDFMSPDRVVIGPAPAPTTTPTAWPRSTRRSERRPCAPTSRRPR